MTRKVLVIGLGLIGGSIALALQKAPETKIIGYDMDAQTREHAKTLNIVHDIVADPLAVAAEVDVIIFGTPVNATLDWMEQLKSWPLKNKVIVTDTGSTKINYAKSRRITRTWDNVYWWTSNGGVS